MQDLLYFAAQSGKFLIPGECWVLVSPTQKFAGPEIFLSFLFSNGGYLNSLLYSNFTAVI